MSSTKHLQEQYELLSEKIHRLKMAVIIEASEAVRFQLEKQIEAAQAERVRIEQQLEGTDKLLVTCPYRGLFAFREQDAPYFFGRDEVIQSVQRQVQIHPFVAVIGASGSGKSSFIFAGLVPELCKQEGWIIASLRPKDRPFEQLALTLVPLIYSDKLKQAEKLKECVQKLQDETINLSQIIQLSCRITLVSGCCLLLTNLKSFIL